MVEIVTMTTWKPNLEKHRGPFYVALADALADDVRTGRVAIGTRLPTHRDLARALGVTVGTVTRGYAEAARRGLLSGEVGRGTFVAARDASRVAGAPRTAPEQAIDLSRNRPNVALGEDLFGRVFDRLRRRGHLEELMQYVPTEGSLRHREAGSVWLERAGIQSKIDEVVVTCGAQHGLLLAFAALARAGETVLAESLTYAGTKAVARFLALKLESVAMDDQGAIPDSFENLCRRLAPKAFYVVPTVQNPTGRCMSPKRREQLVAVARRYKVPLVEDDVYAYFVTDPPKALAAIAPDITFSILGMSKCMAPSLRLGYLRAPSAWTTALISGIASTAHNASPLAAEIASLMLEDGSADMLIERQRKDVAKRHSAARKVLSTYVDPGCRPDAPHLWITLPDPWRATEFVAAAAERGVLVSPAEHFAIGRGDIPHAARISLTAAKDVQEVTRGVEILRGLLESEPSAKPPAV